MIIWWFRTYLLLGKKRGACSFRIPQKSLSSVATSVFCKFLFIQRSEWKYMEDSKKEKGKGDVKMGVAQGQGEEFLSIYTLFSENTIRTISVSQRMLNSMAFLMSPRLLFENVLCRAVGVAECIPR